ncbi:MAG: cyclase family protein [Butyrivibrio sp.]
MELWDVIAEMKTDKYEWVELSHIVSDKTPHWVGFKPFALLSKPLDWHEEPYDVVAHEYSIVSQYGTHIDCPKHFVDDGRTLEKVPATSTMFPLCVVDCSEKVKANADYQLTVEDLKEFEEKYGRIPENAFVAMRSDWSITHADDYENNDADGNPHYPGWSLEALHWLVEERNVGAIGHEPTDTDAPAAGKGWAGELYILQEDKIQIEVMKNLNLLPPTGAAIFCSWPRVEGGVGFSARCIAVFKK